MKNIEFDRAKGCLWGLIVGDCLGSPIQFTEKDNHQFITEMEFCETFQTPPGYWTDDTSMALCIMESFTRLGCYDLKDIANNFSLWYNQGKFSSLPYAFDVGGATREAILGIEYGSIKNGSEESQGNGSIMRFAPSYFIAKKCQSPSICAEISNITHNSNVIRDVVEKLYCILSQHLSGKATTMPSIYSSREDVVNSGWAVSTLNAALWAFHSTNSFEKGMIQAVNLGGDSDSIGAVYGQIAGAYYGFSAIPERWIMAVKSHEKLNSMIEKFLLLTSEQ